ncbi:MAG: hypothetical protein ACU0BK_16540 [Shimia sp.]|uniref:hypothetical protein n=1 Tax=Shimia sp. TaxID=1954381 RepID=UPI00405873A1
MSVSSHIKQVIAAEFVAFDPSLKALEAGGLGKPLPGSWHNERLAAFRSAMIEPEEVRLTFKDGRKEACWAVTASEGYAYQVVWVPSLVEFSMALLAEGELLDINVRGDAIGCFASM